MTIARQKLAATDVISFTLRNAQDGDLYAARVLEDIIEREGLWLGYLDALFQVMDWTVEIDDDSAVGPMTVWKAARATAQQRAQAFLAVTEGMEPQPSATTLERLTDE